MKKEYMEKLNRTKARDEYRLCLEASARIGYKWDRLVTELLGEKTSQDWFAKQIIDLNEVTKSWDEMFAKAGLSDWPADDDEEEPTPMTTKDYIGEAEEMKISLSKAIERAYIERYGFDFIRAVIDTGATIDLDGIHISGLTLEAYENRNH